MREFARDLSAAGACRQVDRAVPGSRQGMDEPHKVLWRCRARIRQGILMLPEVAGKADAGTCCDLPAFQCLRGLLAGHPCELGGEVRDDLSMRLVEAEWSDHCAPGRRIVVRRACGRDTGCSPAVLRTSALVTSTRIKSLG